MQTHGMENTASWLYYYPLLLRYARRIIGDQDAATLLVKKVLADQYIMDGLQPGDGLRHSLKTDTLHHCCCHTQVIIFDRPPIKQSFR